MNDLLNFSAPDLVNLQGWFRKAPKQFTRAANNVANSQAFDGRRIAIAKIKAGTQTRASKFVSKSMRVTKSKAMALNKISAEMGSIDLSRAGRSTGFEELEDGTKYKGSRVPTMASRMGNESKKVSGPVRMNKMAKFYRYGNFAGKGAKTKRQRTAVMLKAIRSGAIGRKPFIITTGTLGPKMRLMKPGVWKLGNKKSMQLVNPFQGKRRKTKKIAWMQRTVDIVTSDTNLKKFWNKEVDHLFKKKRF